VTKIYERFEPASRFIGGFTDNDGTIEFYGRINSIVNENSTVVDLGAGRAAWFEDDECDYRRNLRALKTKVKCVIGLDVDNVVLTNKSTHENRLIENGKLPLKNESVDVLIADYVFEHISDPEQFSSEIQRVLKPGGILCARTPHLVNYVSLGASALPNRLHAFILNRIQPGRKEQDVFPTVYKLNTLSTLRSHFANFKDFSYIFRPDPSYYGGNKSLYRIAKVFHQHMPVVFCGIIFVYSIKDE